MFNPPSSLSSRQAYHRNQFCFSLLFLVYTFDLLNGLLSKFFEYNQGRFINNFSVGIPMEKFHFILVFLNRVNGDT